MRVLLPILAFIILVLLVCWWWARLFFQQPNAVEASTQTTERRSNLQLIQGEKTLLSGFDQFLFEANAAKPILNANNRQFIQKVSAYLEAHPKMLLNITGACSLDEKTEGCGFFENLGLARADAVRSLLLQQGVSPEQITLSYNLGSAGVREQALAFDVYTAAQKIDFIPLAYTFEDMTFSDESFVPNGTEFRPILPLVEYADSVRQFLALNPRKKLSIIGHTDNQGESSANLKLGKDRANNVMRYFRELGIPPGQMAAFSEGNKYPSYDNATEVGRRRNRRINFIIE